MPGSQTISSQSTSSSSEAQSQEKSASLDAITPLNTAKMHEDMSAYLEGIVNDLISVGPDQASKTEETANLFNDITRKDSTEPVYSKECKWLKYKLET